MQGAVDVKQTAPRASALGALLLLTLVGALITYKASGSLRTLEKVRSTKTLAPRAEAVSTATLAPGTRSLARAANYLAIVWPALIFGVLIGAAVRAAIPPEWLARAVGSSPLRAQLVAGAAGAPLMLCSCCVAPVFTAVYEKTRKTGPASALLFASPSLNPVALLLTFLLFPAGVAAVRLGAALVLVFGVSALASRLAGGVAEPESCAPADAERPPAELASFAREVLRLALTTLPTILAGVLLSSLLVDLVPFSRLGGSGLAILLVALVAVPIALPTFAEIPLAIGLLAAGAGAGAAAALLIAGPAINLASLFTLARATSTRFSLALAAGTFGAAVAGGFLAASLI